MLEIGISYNPYRVQTEIKINGEEINEAMKDKIKYENKRLPDWFDSFLEEIFEEHKEEEIALCVHCTPYDADDVRASVEQFNKKDRNYHLKPIIYLDVIEGSEYAEDKIERLKSLLKKAQKGPFDAFRDKKLRQNFLKKLNPDFEVHVVATMSSGKSTIINAMLGQEMMPARNEACTATIAKIKDCDDMTEFKGQRKNAEGKILEKQMPVDQKTLTRWNDDKDTISIELEGNIESISETESARLVLVDTPGPNNSRDKQHYKTTMDAINNELPSMVLYVLNATQLSTNDDNSLLRSVAKAMESGGRQAQDRFVFIANKIDVFDPEKGESVTSALKNVRKYLQDNGINDPTVIPVSAELAKLIRMKKHDKELTRKQKGDLRNWVELFVEEPEMNMVQHLKGHLSSRCYNSLLQKIEEARRDEEKAEILSGIPIVEALLDEFIKKHAVPSKIKDAVDTFRHVMAQAECIERVTEQLKKSEEDLKDIVNQLTAFEQSKDRIKMAKSFREEIKERKYVPSDELEQSYENVQTVLGNLFNEKTEYFQDKKEEEEARDTIEKTVNYTERKIMEIISIIEKGLEQDFLAGLEKLREEYEQKVQDVVNKSFPDDKNDLRKFQAAAMQMPELTSMLQSHGYTEKVCVSHKVSDSEWWNPFSWGKTRTVRDYEDRKFVNMKEVWINIYSSLEKNVQDNIHAATEQAKKQAEEGKKMVLKAMDDIDDVWKKNLKDMKKASVNKKEKQKQIEDNKKRIDWYENFKKELDTILAI